MSRQTLSFILIASSLGFTAFAVSRVPVATAAVEGAVAPAARVEVHSLARARNGSTQKSIAQAPPLTAGGQGGGGGGAGDTAASFDPNGTGTARFSFDGGSGAGTTGDQSMLPH